MMTKDGKDYEEQVELMLTLKNKQRLFAYQRLSSLDDEVGDIVDDFKTIIT